jgi:hypothetical protein
MRHPGKPPAQVHGVAQLPVGGPPGEREGSPDLVHHLDVREVEAFHALSVGVTVSDLCHVRIGLRHQIRDHPPPGPEQCHQVEARKPGPVGGGQHRR